MKNLREYNLFVLNLNSTGFITLKSSIRTAKCSRIIGFPVGQEQMSHQQEYYVSTMKVRLTIHDLLLFILRNISIFKDITLINLVILQKSLLLMIINL